MKLELYIRPAAVLPLFTVHATRSLAFNSVMMKLAFLWQIHRGT